MEIPVSAEENEYEFKRFEFRYQQTKLQASCPLFQYEIWF
jgi:hypothetical protein